MTNRGLIRHVRIYESAIFWGLKFSAGMAVYEERFKLKVVGGIVVRGIIDTYR